MNWTTPVDIRAQVQRLWDRGRLLGAIAEDVCLFPLRLTTRSPSSQELGNNFREVQQWIAELNDGQARGYRIVWRTVKHRVIGENRIPDQIWIDDLERAIALIDKQREAIRFRTIIDETRERQPRLLAWMSTRPLKALDLAEDWPRLLSVVDWLQAHPRPGIYLRQIDIPGVDTKFIEKRRGVLAQLFDATLPPEAIDSNATGAAGFCARYGFLDRPSRVRFRILDRQLAGRPYEADRDVAISHEAFAALKLPIRRVFVTENETNFLAFPMAPESIVVFGGGYGFDALAQASWLHRCAIHYWGDIDTHGFAILDQLRSRFPHAVSFLMDRRTLLEHRAHWVEEPRPQRRRLRRLSGDEAALLDDLVHDRLGHHVRLEQERVGFDWLRAAITTVQSERDETAM